jgi:hypothetical protein
MGDELAKDGGRGVCDQVRGCSVYYGGRAEFSKQMEIDFVTGNRAAVVKFCLFVIYVKS